MYLHQNHFRKTFTAGHHRENILSLVSDEIQENQLIFPLESFFQGTLDVAGLFNFNADMPITLSQFDKIRQGIHVRFGLPVTVEELLPLSNHTHVAIIQVDNF